MQFLEDWLSHPDYWFLQKDETDIYLTNKYESLLNDTWDKKQVDIYHHLLHIIINDQLVRHVYRYQSAAHIISYHLQKALSIHFYMRRNYHLYTQLTGPEWMFWGLPIRHSQNATWIHNLIQKTWEKLNITENNDCLMILKKFLTASFQRMPISQNSFLEYFSNTDKGSMNAVSEYIPILDYYPITPPEYTISMLEPLFRNYIQAHSIKSCIISLSGGVDSMVCSYILKQLKVNVIAVYIDYCNRTKDEAKFIQEWCHYIQLPLYMRSIHEIQREPCMRYNMRNIYESYTRNVRYQCYKDAWNMSGEPYVFLGHNKDDCFENILTNICHQNKYDNLEGMKELMYVDGIHFCRPMLSIPKQVIYTEAQRLGIPYLKDSTPSWSQRGQIRDSIRPVLNKWDERMIPAMFQVGKMLSEAETYKQIILDKWNQQTLYTNKMWTIRFDTTDYKALLCQSLWHSYFESKEMIVKQKSLKHFIESLHRAMCKKQDVKCLLNKTHTISYTYNTQRISIEF